MDVATIHTVGPDDIIGERGQYAVYIPRVKAIVDALKEFDITIHWFSPWHGAPVARGVGLIAQHEYTMMATAMVSTRLTAVIHLFSHAQKMCKFHSVNKASRGPCAILVLRC
jgi:hypothetical protein